MFTPRLLRRPAQRTVLLLATMLALAGLSTSIQAQSSSSYPAKPVRLIIPFPPGGPADVLGRAIAQRLSQKWAQPVVVDNKGGANTLIAAQEAARAAPDGYTLFMPLDSTYTMNPALYSRLPYDPIKDFASISIVARQSLVLTATDRTTFKTVTDLVTAARADPGGINYGSSTTSTQLAGELFTRQTGTKLVQVPYRGASEVVKGMHSGDVQVSFDGIAANVPHIRTGKIRALATTGPTRSAALPDVPTLAEAGLKGYELVMWNALSAPAGTPKAIIDKINKDVIEIVQRKDVKDQLLIFGLETAGTSPEEMNETIQRETAKYAPLIKELGLKLD
ncbi:tripartite tricarboxylate transporter substrate binding protein [Variovorax sp. J31P207]|uniref:Bug family tripartite tricarboxylate transporter substrate binding protein n=1 Tax=Variovorax sp. J31P207 TaxID=3053510 RepID=UPI0025787CD6|nr:tripartite tricarboxylate transporter substrate binding protein [Variovorax sp. J31P207]MDM0066898.1 tripartite tricarboxylate transporter substrate binding protein [Variovorax sp. J31P207]